MESRQFVYLVIVLAAFVCCLSSIADDKTDGAQLVRTSGEVLGPGGEPVYLGDEYTGYKRERGDPMTGNPDESTMHKVLLYIPNRVVDFIDIFRVDVGAGPAVGGVVRVTKWAQAGYREMDPGSLRIGLHGRRFPAWVERDNEYGFGPSFNQSDDREVTPGEVGVGVDLLLVSGYVGVSVDEAFDFVAGIFTIDVKDDDF